MRAVWVSPGEAAHLTGLSVDTLARYAAAGDITCIRTIGNHRRYSTVSIDALIAAASE